MRPRKKINQTDIAKALGISSVSVSNALAGRKGVSEDLTRKVRQKAVNMGYEAGASAEGAPRELLLAAPSGGQSAERADCFQKILQGQGFQVRRRTACELLDRARASELQNCAGILVFEALPAGELLALREKSKGPVVGVGFFDSRVPIDYVMDDGFHGAQSMVQYLRGRGYERIFYVKPEERGAAADAEAAARDDRLLGYRSEIYLETLHRGLTMNQAQPFDIGAGKEILTRAEALEFAGTRRAPGRERKAGENPHTVLFCGDAGTALDLLSDLAGRQIRVPDDVAVAGYAVGEDQCRQAKKARLTVYESDEKTLLDQCVEVIRSRGRGREESGKLHLVSGEIIEGSTV